VNRREALDKFYSILDDLRERVGGCRELTNCDRGFGWPERGVYFFFEPGEFREDGRSQRVVRVGTHALKLGSRTTLWNRLSQHRGQVGGRYGGGGNQRGSIFRHLVGEALSGSGKISAEMPSSWNEGMTARGAIRENEHELEVAVSQYIGKMPFLWFGVDDPSGPQSARRAIETGSIALLSNFVGDPVDPPSKQWLGLSSSRGRVRSSGLWNSRDVEKPWSEAFLAELGRHSRATGRARS
jgi:hypothetical protein